MSQKTRIQNIAIMAILSHLLYGNISTKLVDVFDGDCHQTKFGCLVLLFHPPQLPEAVIRAGSSVDYIGNLGFVGRAICLHILFTGFIVLNHIFVCGMVIPRLSGSGIRLAGSCSHCVCRMRVVDSESYRGGHTLIDRNATLFCFFG